MKYVTLTLIILVLSSTPLLAIGNANALQPYVAGNSQQTVVKSAAAVHMQTSFTGTTLSGIASLNWVGSIMSTAGWASTTSTDPTGYNYQNFVDLNPSGTIKGDAEIYKNTGTSVSKVFDCDNTAQYPAGCPSIGQFSTTSSIYQAISFNDVGKTQIRFHYETYKNDGTGTVYTDTVASKSVYDSTDPTSYFSVGETTLSGNNGRIKFLQFGVEQGDTTNTGWKVKQYNLGYTQNLSDISLSTNPAYSIKYGTNPLDTSDPYNSINTYKISGSTIGYSRIGQIDDTNVGADYNIKVSTVPKGEIRYYYTTTTADKLAKGTQLWN